jgi:hypothetical protein
VRPNNNDNDSDSDIAGSVNGLVLLINNTTATPHQVSVQDDATCQLGLAPAEP